jgi:prophage DNA circulation protein
MSDQGGAAAATAAQTLIATLAGNVADPADAIRLLTQLAQYAPPVTAASTPIGGLVGDLFRRLAVIALAQTTTSYQPSSQDDANAVRLSVAALISAEAQKAADQAEDAVFDALRALRTAVIQDMKARGANLAPITTFNPAANLPAVVLAYRYYRDATRADELVAQVNPVHPLFMPRSYQALAS